MKISGVTVAVCLACAVMLGAAPWCALQVGNAAMAGGRLGNAQKALWNSWYQFVLYMAPLSEFSMMNWGMGAPFHECAKNQAEATQSNLYLELASMAEFKGDVLEVGSGRGGGANVLSNCLCPKQYMGLDLNPGQVNSAQQHFGKKDKCPLSFVVGDAENLPFPSDSVDVVLSAETSHTYPHFDKFVQEVHRVLRPSGTFHITDFRDPGDMEKMMEDISSKFGPAAKMTDISARVVQALADDIRPEGARGKLVHNLCPSFMMGACMQFVGGSAMVNLQNKTKFYSMALFRKAAHGAEDSQELLTHSMELVKEPVLLRDFMWTGVVYMMVYLASSVWCTSLEMLSGFPFPLRPWRDYGIIGFNSFLVFCNVIWVCYSVRENPPCSLLNYFCFFIAFDFFLYSMHRYVMHGSKLPGSKLAYKALHSWHHARNGNNVVALDLFYMHPLDCLLQFLLPIDLAMHLASMDLYHCVFAGCLAVFYNSLAHSRIMAYDHVDHHGNEHVSFGVGIFMDQLLGSAKQSGADTAGTWIGIFASYFLFKLMGAWIVTLALAYMVSVLVKVVLANNVLALKQTQLALKQTQVKMPLTQKKPTQMPLNGKRQPPNMSMPCDI